MTNENEDKRNTSKCYIYPVFHFCKLIKTPEWSSQQILYISGTFNWWYCVGFYREEGQTVFTKTVLTTFPALALADSYTRRCFSLCLWKRNEIWMSWCFTGSHKFADLKIADIRKSVVFLQNRTFWSDLRICKSAIVRGICIHIYMYNMCMYVYV